MGLVELTSSVEPTGVAVATPLQHALDGFVTSLGHLVKVVGDGGLEDLDANGLIAFLQDFESVRNAMSSVDHAVIQRAVERGVPHAVCQRSIGRVLTCALRISAAEAGRRVRAAAHLGDRWAMTGEPLGPWRPHLAEAVRLGEITSEQVGVIDTALRRVDGPGFDPGDVEAGEQILLGAAAGIGPEDLRVLAEKVVDAIDPDGTLPDDQLQQDRRFLHLRHAKDGSFRGEFRLSPEVGAKLKAILDPLAAPNQTVVTLGDEGSRVASEAATADRPACAADGSAGSGGSAGQTGTRMVEVDPRSRGQRMHDALGRLCDRLLRSAAPSDSGGTPATVVVTIDEVNLRNRTGFGFLSDGVPVGAQTVIDLADQADLAWCVKNSRGTVLALGRSRRIASRQQSLALIARDGGCSFPGCDVPAEWSERHHIVPWVEGGRTDLDNLTLLCRYHHHYFAQRGWSCRVNADRLPEWIPPKWIDRQQRPILHSRIKIRRWRPRQPPPDTHPPW